MRYFKGYAKAREPHTERIHRIQSNRQVVLFTCDRLRSIVCNRFPVITSVILANGITKHVVSDVIDCLLLTDCCSATDKFPPMLRVNVHTK